MVQIIQPNIPVSTIRQQALDQALGNILSGLQGMEETKRQQALRAEQQAIRAEEKARQDEALKLKFLEMGVNPQDALTELRSGRQIISSAAPAQEAVYGEELQGPVMPGQAPLRQLLSQAIPAKEAVFAPSAFEPYFSKRKMEQEQKAQDLERKRQIQEGQLSKLQRESDLMPLEIQKAEAQIARQRALTQKALAETTKAKKEGAGKQLSASDVAKFQEGNVIPAMLTDVKSVIDQNKDIFGPVGGRISALNPYDVRGQTIESTMKTASQAFGKFMEGGVLRKEDEEKYRKMFPSLSDTPDVAQNKLQVVNKLLTDKQSSTLEALRKSGFDIQGIQKEFLPAQLPSILSGKKESQGMIPEAQAGGMPWQKYGAKK